MFVGGIEWDEDHEMDYKENSRLTSYHPSLNAAE